MPLLSVYLAGATAYTNSIGDAENIFNKQGVKRMVVKGAKTIAEYAIKKWLLDQGFVMECFSLSITGMKRC